MKYALLVWKSLGRRKVRTIFTGLSILVAFVLFGYLSAIKTAFELGVDVIGANRLMILHKVSLIQPLPLSYKSRLAAIPGVVKVTHANWFGGKYQDYPEGRFGIFPVPPEEFLDMYPEYVLSAEARQRWFADRTGMIAGRVTAEAMGWKVGDRVPIQGTFFRRKDGGDTWEFTVDGIYEGAEQGVDETIVMIHWEYFNEARELGEDLVGWYIVHVDNPDNSARIAERIDATFANSSYETETSTEKAFVQSFANQIGNIGKILRLVLTAVFFTILLVAGNTMAQSVRERTSELAVLKTLGFRDGMVLALVLAESLLLAGFGGGLGLVVGWTLIVTLGDPTGGFLPAFFMPARDVMAGVVLIVVLGVVSGVLPALQAGRLRIVDALRRV